MNWFLSANEPKSNPKRGQKTAFCGASKSKFASRKASAGGRVHGGYTGFEFEDLSRMLRVGIIGMGYIGRTHCRALHHILDCVRSRQKPALCPAEESLQVMRVMDASRRSAESCEAVRFSGD